MGLRKRRVVISKKAKDSLKQYIEYLKNEVSVDVSEKVRRGIIARCRKLENFAGYSKERYLEGESVDYRSVTLWDYNIIYIVTTREVRILNIIHTSKNPQNRKDV